jgi:hypothetical protein
MVPYTAPGLPGYSALSLSSRNLGNAVLPFNFGPDSLNLGRGTVLGHAGQGIAGVIGIFDRISPTGKSKRLGGKGVSFCGIEFCHKEKVV